MLKIINNFAPFFEDCYRKISVREYARLMKVTPPTASTVLKAYHQQGFLHQREEHHHLFFSLNTEDRDVIDLSRMYWRKKLASLSQEVEKRHLQPTGILFGSLAKAEAKQDSDVDLAIFSPQNKPMNLTPYEKELKRTIALY
ncbi:nucleotidyltransferase domain-containing protein, partial [Candidatus Woesearchaeota archaeon]|nr:nucleotidyltransferase domain-containing protein [Candidatus Woesearchaeota archaeon]